MIDFLRTHPARVYSVAVAVLALVASFGVDVPAAQILGVIAAVFGLAGGELVQRVEDRKTAEAAE
jgi:hypothetical protein